MSKRLERENAQAEIDEFVQYGAPKRIKVIEGFIEAHEFDAASMYLRDLAAACSNINHRANKLADESP